MKKLIFIFTMFFAVTSLCSCSLAKVDGDEEGVFIKKPYLFGKGGVSADVLTEG